LGRGHTLLGKLADVFGNVGGGDLLPTSGGSLVWSGTLGDTLSWTMHSTHGAVKKKE